MLAYKSSYYNIVVPLMAHAITKRCGREVTRACKKDSHRIYRDLLTKAPNIGKNNPMEHNIYMAIALFSLQLSSKGALSVEDFKAYLQRHGIEINERGSRTEKGALLEMTPPRVP